MHNFCFLSIWNLLQAKKLTLWEFLRGLSEKRDRTSMCERVLEKTTRTESEQTTLSRC